MAITNIKDAPQNLVSEEIALYVGTFNEGKQDEVWKKESTFKSLSEGYVAFKNYCKKCVAYSYEELVEIYDVPRLDIELLQGNNLVKWMGIYERDLEEVSQEDKK